MRKLEGGEVAYLHVNGFDHPTVHVFASFEAAMGYIGETEHMPDSSDVLVDENGDQWYPYSAEVVVEHGEEGWL